MQHMLEHGGVAHRSILCNVLQTSISQVASDIHAVAVLGKVLECCTDEEKMLLIGELLAKQGSLSRMARTRYGHTTAKLVLELADAFSCGLEEAARQLAAEADTLRVTRYGRSVMTCLTSLLDGTPVPRHELSEQMQEDIVEQMHPPSRSMSEALSL